VAETGLASLGLDVRSLIFQVVNFAVLALVLYRFAFRPLLRVLEKRQRTITESLKSAADIERTKEEAAASAQQIVQTARQQAEAIITRSTQEGSHLREQAQAAGEKAAAELMTRAEASIIQKVAAARTQLKRETLGLVAAATKRVLGEKLDDEKDQALITAALAAVQPPAKPQ